MASDDPRQLKQTLRDTMRRRIAAMPQGAACDTTALDRWLAAHPEAATIATYAALPGEVDLSDLVARHSGRRWLYPRVEGGELHFHAVNDPAIDLKPGTFGVREPSPALPRVDVMEIDAFFCPGLAFDDRGGRLGRGRGFYDRMLHRARTDALRIGIGFTCQWAEDTFAEPHDIPMHGVFFC